MEKARELGLHEQTYILAGVGPLKSPGMARYMKNNVPGILVPDEIIERMSAASAPWAGKSKDELTKEDKRDRSRAWRETGIQICIELIQRLREIEGVSGPGGCRGGSRPRRRRRAATARCGDAARRRQRGRSCA